MTDTVYDHDREIVTTRVVAHPRARIFRAFTTPSELQRWWGPAGFTNTFEICEPVPGGQWRYTMHGPDGRNYPNESRFREVAPERIVIEHVVEPHFVLTVTLEDWGDRTKIVWRQVFDTKRIRDAINTFAGQGNEDNLDRMIAVIDGAR